MAAMLHLMVGLPCSGKTTLAKNLERELQALRLTPDEWHFRLFGDDLAHPDHDLRHDRIEDLMWNVAAAALGRDIPVILDYGFWKAIEREDYRTRAKNIGCPTMLHYLDVPDRVLFRRLDIRNSTAPPGSFKISPAQLKAWLSHFEPPSDDELHQSEALR